jgi:enamine deaminase RidA (YjgF/YER057c/UK114 family)
VRSRHLSRSDPPANTLVQVSSLARPELLIEIEAVAIIGNIVRQ